MNPTTNKPNNQDPSNPDSGAAVLGFGTQVPMKAQAQGYAGFSGISPGQAKASLGIATLLQQHLLPQGKKGIDPSSKDGQQQQTPTEQKPEEKAPQEENKDNSHLQEMEGKIEQLSKDLRGEMDSKIAKEIGDIKKLIQDALNGEE